MAKVDTIEMHVDGKLYSYNVNVGKSGIFTCKIDYSVARILGIESSVEFTQLKELKAYILNPYYEYLKAKVLWSLWIGIEFRVSGKFAYRPDGERLFQWSDGKASGLFEKRGFAGELDSLSFEFRVYLKEENSTGTSQWFEARLEENKWVKYRTVTRPLAIVIPYSDESHETLKRATKGLQLISASLFDVLNQDTSDLDRQLQTGVLKMLNPSPQGSGEATKTGTDESTLH